MRNQYTIYTIDFVQYLLLFGESGYQVIPARARRSRGSSISSSLGTKAEASREEKDGLFRRNDGNGRRHHEQAARSIHNPCAHYPRSVRVIASVAKQSIAQQKEKWIASLRSQ